jgi:hypothetical protein
LSLRACLCIVLAHVLIVSGNKSDDGLFSLVANVDTNKHSFIGDLCTKVHSPEITSQFGIDLSYNIQINAVIVTDNGLSRNEL